MPDRAGEGEAATGSFTELHREMYTQAVMDVAFLHGSTVAVARRNSNYLMLFDCAKLRVCVNIMRLLCPPRSLHVAICC